MDRRDVVDAWHHAMQSQNVQEQLRLPSIHALLEQPDHRIARPVSQPARLPQHLLQQDYPMSSEEYNQHPFNHEVPYYEITPPMNGLASPPMSVFASQSDTDMNSVYSETNSSPGRHSSATLHEKRRWQSGSGSVSPISASARQLPRQTTRVTKRVRRSNNAFTVRNNRNTSIFDDPKKMAKSDKERISRQEQAFTLQDFEDALLVYFDFQSPSRQTSGNGISSGLFTPKIELLKILISIGVMSIHEGFKYARAHDNLNEWKAENRASIEHILSRDDVLQGTLLEGGRDDRCSHLPNSSFCITHKGINHNTKDYRECRQEQVMRRADQKINAMFNDEQRQ